MRYIDASLAPGEDIIQRGKWPTLFWVGAWAALILLGIIVVGIFIFIRSAIIMSTTDFAVTNRRVILKRGWLNRRTEELAVESVEGVLLDQSLFARIFGYGRIIVTGTGDARIRFPPMAHPVAFRRSIEAARARGDEVHLAHDDREALERATEAHEHHAEPANESRADHEDEDDEEGEPRRRRKRSSFIGLRARR
jgi:uncharacterized membrane protein YdbT with pleckstrin-like domain